MQHPVDERGGHHVVTEDLPPLLEAFVRSQHCGGMLIATIHELEEEYGAGMIDRQVADLVDDEQRRMRKDGEALCQSSGSLCLLQRGDQIDQGPVVHASSTLCRGDRQADCQMCLAYPGWA